MTREPDETGLRPIKWRSRGVGLLSEVLSGEIGNVLFVKAVEIDPLEYSESRESDEVELLG